MNEIYDENSDLGLICELEEQVKVLKERCKLLTALEAAGVDNWQGYDDAISILEDMSE